MPRVSNCRASRCACTGPVQQAGRSPGRSAVRAHVRVCVHRGCQLITRRLAVFLLVFFFFNVSLLVSFFFFF